MLLLVGLIGWPAVSLGQRAFDGATILPSADGGFEEPPDRASDGGSMAPAGLAALAAVPLLLLGVGYVYWRRAKQAQLATQDELPSAALGP